MEYTDDSVFGIIKEYLSLMELIRGLHDFTNDGGTITELVEMYAKTKNSLSSLKEIPKGLQEKLKVDEFGEILDSISVDKQDSSYARDFPKI